MTIRLSPGVEHLQRLVGIEFPQADEDALWRCARAWRTAATDLRALPPDAVAIGAQIQAALGGDMGAAFADAWQPFNADNGLLDRLAQACDELAAACDHAATEVEYAKLAFILALMALASTLSAISAVLVVGGVAALGIPLAIRTAQLTIRLVLTHLAIAVALRVAVNAALDAVVQAVRFGPGLFGASPDLTGGRGVVGLPAVPSAPGDTPDAGLVGSGLIGGFGPSSGHPPWGTDMNRSPSGLPGMSGYASPTDVRLTGHAAPTTGPSPHDSGNAGPPVLPAPGSPALPLPPSSNPAPGNPAPVNPPSGTTPSGSSPRWVPPAAAPPGAGQLTPSPGQPGSGMSGPGAPAPGVPGGGAHVIGAPSIGSPGLVAGGVAGLDSGAATVGPIAVLSVGPRVADPSSGGRPSLVLLPGSAGPVTDAEAIAVVRRTIFKTEAGYGFYAPDDETREFARAIEPIKGFVTLDLHGRSDGFRIENGLLAPRQFIAALRDLHRTGEFDLPPGAGIKLLAGYTGGYPAGDPAGGTAGDNTPREAPGAIGAEASPAAMLARELGVQVMAPDQPVWTGLAGEEILASPRLAHGNVVPADPPNGRWHPIDPSGRTVPAPPAMSPADRGRVPVATDR